MYSLKIRIGDYLEKIRCKCNYDESGNCTDCQNLGVIVDTEESHLLYEAFSELYLQENSIRSNALNKMARQVFEQNLKVGWWPKNIYSMTRPEKVTLLSSKLALVHSEISEALEGLRKNLNDDHLKERPMFEVELADTIIRILDIAGYCELDLGGALSEKFEYNKNRADHKLENRLKDGGKLI